jgi:hypothetical protein
MVWIHPEAGRPEEEDPLLKAFGDDVDLDLIERSLVDPRVMIVWVGWYRLPPSIYLVSFQTFTPTGTPYRREYMHIEDIKASAEWGRYFPPRDEAQGEPGSATTTGGGA